MLRVLAPEISWRVRTEPNTRWGARNSRAERASIASPTHEPELGNSSGGTAACLLSPEPPANPPGGFFIYFRFRNTSAHKRSSYRFGYSTGEDMADSRDIATAEKTADHAAPGLQVSGASVGYEIGHRDRFVVASDVSLQVSAGEFAAVIGPSGCGKSTLLSAIAGLAKPFAGEIAIDGNPDAKRLGNVAYMQQKDLLLPWRTVLSNARMGLELSGVRRSEADAFAAERASVFGLGDVVNSYPWQLSGGMRQRAALLRATLPESSVLLLDEPFGALDAITRRHLQHWLASILDRAKRAVLLVTHDIEEALLLADRVYVMSPGPGTIVETVDVPIARPRTDDVVTSADFIALKARLMSVLSETASGVANEAVV